MENIIGNAMLLLDGDQNIAIFCQNTAGLFSLLGIFITAIKIFVPLALIIFGMLDMGKAVTSGKDDEIQKQLVVFIKRVIAGIIVFFIPTIVGMIMQMINTSISDIDTCGYSQCVSAVFGVSGKCN